MMCMNIMKIMLCYARLMGWLIGLQAVNSEWRALADDVALDKFQQHWGLRSLGGTPRSTAALPVRI